MTVCIIVSWHVSMSGVAALVIDTGSDINYMVHDLGFVKSLW